MSSCDDIPIGGCGAYKINWDELENMDPSMAIPQIRKSNFGKNNFASNQKQSSEASPNNIYVENEDSDNVNLPPPPVSQLNIEPCQSARNSLCDFPSPPSPYTIENDINQTKINDPSSSEETKIKISSFSVDSGLDNSPNEIHGKSLTSSGYETALPSVSTNRPKQNLSTYESEISQSKLNYQNGQEESYLPDSEDVMNLSQDSLSENLNYNSRVRRNTFDKIEANQTESVNQNDRMTSSFTSQKEISSSQDSFMSTNEEIPTEADSSVYTSVSSNINVITIDHSDSCIVQSSEDLTPKPSLTYQSNFKDISPVPLQNENLSQNQKSHANTSNSQTDLLSETNISDEIPNMRSTNSKQALKLTQDDASEMIIRKTTSISTAIQTDENLDSMPIHDNAELIIENNDRLQDKIVALQKENDALTAKVTELNSTIVDMTHCVKEYEHTFEQLAEDKIRIEAEFMESSKTLVMERDQALEDLFTMEKAFGDLHRRFEKTKQVIDSFKQNEESMNKCIADHQQKLKRHEQKYEILKQHAEEKLKIANDEISEVRRSKEAEIAKLQAALKMAELQEGSLQSQLNQKTVENNELTKICDELIAKCGT